MISNVHFKILDTANRELAQRFEKIKKARASSASTLSLRV